MKSSQVLDEHSDIMALSLPGYLKMVADVQWKDRMEMDALKTLDFKAYNILPLETPGVADAIMLFEEVRLILKINKQLGVSSLKF